MIENFKHKHSLISLYNKGEVQPNSNVFSILVGKNGAGKSTLLSKLTTELIAKKRTSSGKELFDENQHKKNFPSEIIAVSTSPFDKFSIDRYNEVPNYTYLGLRDLSGIDFGIAYLSKIIASLIESILDDPRQAYEIGRVLDYLGYKDEIWANFRLLSSRRMLEELTVINDPVEFFKNMRPSHIRSFHKSFFLNKDDTLSQKKVLKLKEIASRILNKQSFRSTFDLFITRNGLSLGDSASEDILFLVQSGFLRLKDVSLKSNKENISFSIRNASSGEQSIILSILGIASKIKEGSLICIDEPEICLHPQWQEKYIDILTQAFLHHKGCQFIIATHSPQIVSNLSKHNSFIVDMENNKTRIASEFINHSADYQLANVFDSPGFKNEYLSRIALNIFSKVSKSRKFDMTDLDNFRNIERLSRYLNHNDPVYDLYIALKEMKKIYG